MAVFSPFILRPFVSSASFTRPANTTAYAAGGLVANSTTAGSVVPLTFPNFFQNYLQPTQLVRARLYKSGTVLTNASFRLHLFESLPVPTVGDGGVFQSAGALATTGGLTYLTSLSFTLNFAGTDGASGQATPVTGNLVHSYSRATSNSAAAKSLYGLLEATAAYTPVSAEVFTATLELLRPCPN